MSTINIFKVSFEIWGCVICVILSILSGPTVFRVGGALKKAWIMLLLNCLFLSGGALNHVFDGDMSAIGIAINRVGCFVLLFAEGTLVWLLSYIVKQIVSTEKNARVTSAFFRLTSVCVVVHLVGLILTPFTDFYYFFDPMNRYIRGSGFLVPYISLGLAAILIIMAIFRYRTRIPVNVWMAFASLGMMLSGSMIIQLFWLDAFPVSAAVTLSILLIFISLWNDSRTKEFEDHIMGMEKIIAELRSGESRGDSQ